MLDALQTIAQSMLDSIIVYKTGYNRIDESTDFAISQEHISGMRKQLAKNCMDMDTIAETVEDLLRSVSELITIED